jgi:acetyl coenzyme A synthetase (ADP forming)-like protein
VPEPRQDAAAAVDAVGRDLPESTDVVLRDGSTVCLRNAHADDAGVLLQFLQALPDDRRAHRLLAPSLTPASLRELMTSGDGRAVALVAETAGQVVGFGGFYRHPEDARRAEVALVVADAMQGHGIGTRLLERLTRLARRQHIATFDAHVLGREARILDVLRQSGLALTEAPEGDGHTLVELSLASLDQFEERSAMRSQIAATASVRPFFEPRVVAVVGANRRRGRIGSEILHNIAERFTGRVVPVHPEAAEIDGRRAWPRVSDIPGTVDLAVIAVPAADVLGAVDDCIRKDVPAICVISAGFGESGADGRAREAEIVRRIREAGCRLIGPNCMGLLNTDPAIRLNATFSPVFPPAGRVAMSTQSGALGLAILDYAKRLGIGISSFVSIGNKADVSGNDLIQYWAEDPKTSVILLYVESFGNPKKFSQLARRVGRTKPIVAVKAGRSAAGSRAAASHTGALASSDVVVDALFRQSGVIRTERLEEMFDAAVLLSQQPLPRGRRAAIVTNAGGPAILAADACESSGLVLPPLGDATRAALRAFLPAAASVGNPVDMLASASPEHYRRTLALVLGDETIDSVITIFIPPLITDPTAVAAAVADAARTAPDKPVLGVFMRSEGAPAALAPIPAYDFPESAALALARVTTYGQWRSKPLAPAPVLSRFDADGVRRRVERLLAAEPGWLPADEAFAILGEAGIQGAPFRVVPPHGDVLAAAAAVGYPVALKALGPALVHKTERRAVQLNLGDARALAGAVDDLLGRLGTEVTSLLVQKMVPRGIEMIVGAVQDPLFGPVIACGTGGIFVDVAADTAFRLHPLSDADAREMIDELRGARLLRGYRGAPAVDEAALRDVVLRVSELVAAAPEIQEMDLNPVIVLSSGACVADVRIRIGPITPAQRGRRIEY